MMMLSLLRYAMLLSLLFSSFRHAADCCAADVLYYAARHATLRRCRDIFATIRRRHDVSITPLLLPPPFAMPLLMFHYFADFAFTPITADYASAIAAVIRLMPLLFSPMPASLRLFRRYVIDIAFALP